MRDTDVESHPFRKVREKDGDPAMSGAPALPKIRS
jgi:hypothetical protein